MQAASPPGAAASQLRQMAAFWYWVPRVQTHPTFLPKRGSVRRMVPVGQVLEVVLML